MLTTALALVLLATARWLRPRRGIFAAQPAAVVVPGLLTAAFVNYAWPRWGQTAFVLLISLVVIVAHLERRAGTQPLCRRRAPARLSLVRERPAWIALALITWLAARDLMQSGWNARALVGGAAGVAVVLGLHRARRGGALTAGFVAWCSCLFIAASLIAGNLLDREWIDCRAEFGKCTVTGRIYQGIFNSENALAYFCCLALLTVLMTGISKRSLMTTSALTGIVLITGSRTSTYSLGLTALALVVPMLAATRTGGSLRLRRAVSIGIPVATAAVGVWLFQHAQPGSYSMRGSVWSEASGYLSGNQWLGLGRSTYVDLLTEGHFRGHYPHSEYLLLMFFGGAVALALYVALLASLLAERRAGTRRSLALASGPVLFIGFVGLAELSWNPLGVDGNLWTLSVLFVMRPPTRVRAGRRMVDLRRALTPPRELSDA